MQASETAQQTASRVRAPIKPVRLVEHPTRLVPSFDGAFLFMYIIASFNVPVMSLTKTRFYRSFFMLPHHVFGIKAHVRAFIRSQGSSPD